MTDTPISPLRRRMIEDMTVRRFAGRTQEGYIRAVKGFSTFLGASPATASAEDLRRYRLHLVESGVGAPTINPSLTALRFLFLVTLRKPAIVLDMPFVREPRRLPVVLSPQEVARLLDAAPGLAGRQDVDARRATKNCLGQLGRRVDHVLAIVEQQQHPLVPEAGDQTGKRILGADFQAEDRCNRARHQARVAERRQIDQPHAVFIALDHALGDGEGDRGLADAAGPDDRHQALARQSRDERRHGFVAADHSSYRERQIVRPRRRDCRGQRGLRWLLKPDRGNEIVAPPRNAEEIAMAVMALAEGAAQGADLNPKGCVFDEGLRPGAGDQFLLADNFAGAFDEGG
jgi:hypothetical protein